MDGLLEGDGGDRGPAVSRDGGNFLESRLYTVGTIRKNAAQYLWRRADVDQQLDELIDYYAPGETYICTEGTRSAMIETARVKVILSERICGPGWMRTIAMTKAHVRKRLDDGLIQAVPRSGAIYHVNPAYYPCGRTVCVDVRSAYITSAYLIGALGEGMFARLMRVSKPLRLAALGSLARRGTQTTVIDGVEVEHVDIVNVKLKEIWDRICDNLNHDIADSIGDSGNDVLGYWVDNIYVRKGYENKIIHNLNELGYETHIEEGPINPEMERHFERLKARGKIPAPRISERRKIELVKKARESMRRVVHENVG